MDSRNQIVSSEVEMMAFGKTLAAKLKKGDVVLLRGPLGAGKTTLVKGIVEALAGVDPLGVQSPTFAYVHPYQGKIPLFHFDLYRLEDEKVFFDLDLDAYLSAGGISLIEWPERVPSLTSERKNIIELHLSYHPDGRSIEVIGL